MAIRLSNEQENLRLELYRRGLSSAEIARQVGIDSSSVRKWRIRRNLPSKNETNETRKPKKPREWGGVRMESALPPEGCKLVRTFLRALITCARQLPSGHKPDVSAFIDEWRRIYTDARYVRRR